MSNQKKEVFIGDKCWIDWGENFNNLKLEEFLVLKKTALGDFVVRAVDTTSKHKGEIAVNHRYCYFDKDELIDHRLLNVNSKLDSFQMEIKKYKDYVCSLEKDADIWREAYLSLMNLRSEKP